MSKNNAVLSSLYKSIEDRDGSEKLEQLQLTVKRNVFEGMSRETICQILALERPKQRFLFLALHPRYIVPYLIRIRGNQVVNSSS